MYQIEKTIQEHLKYVRESVSDGWDLIHQEGEMKVYRREVEENGIVVDPLKCFHTIKVRTNCLRQKHENFRCFFLLLQSRVSLVVKFVIIFGIFNIEWNGKVRSFEWKTMVRWFYCFLVRSNTRFN